METGIKFRIIKDDKLLGDTPRMIIPDAKRKILNGEFILAEYQKMKDRFPGSEIMVICETIHWETYMPMSKLLIDDIYELVNKSDKVLKKGLL